MDINELLMIVLAFVLGYMLPGMMKNMCGQRLVEGNFMGDAIKYIPSIAAPIDLLNYAFQSPSSECIPKGDSCEGKSTECCTHFCSADFKCI
jgi:hypothetical protein